MKKLIVTTLLEKKILSTTSKKFDFVFLSKWTQSNYSQINNKKEIIKHPLIDRLNRKNFNYKIIKIYKKYLIKLTAFLNEKHKVNYSKKYWEIIIGYWLLTVLVSLYQKFLIVKKIKNSSKLFIFSFDRTKDSYKFDSTEEFMNSTWFDPYWNNFIFCFFIKNLKKNIRIKKIKIDDYDKFNEIESFKSIFKKKIRVIVISTVNAIVSFFLKKKKQNLIITSFLGMFQEILLQFKMKGHLIVGCDNTYNFSKKNFFSYHKLDINKNFKNRKFENLIEKLLIEFLPSSFTDDHSNILKFVNRSHWTKEPNTVVTSYNIYHDDIFKIWLADKKKNFNTKLIFLPHGGGFQTETYSFKKYFISKVADKILTFGKLKDKNKKFIPFGFVRKKKGFQIKKNQKNILILQDFAKPYFMDVNSSALDSEDLDRYVTNQLEVIRNLNSEKSRQILIRYGSIFKQQMDYEKMLWERKNIKNLRFELRTKSIYSSFEEAYLVVITQISGTTFLECLSLNKPFVIFADLKMQIVQNKFKKFLKLLKKNNLLFDDIYSFSNFLNNNNKESINRLWKLKKIQKIIKLLQFNYANNLVNPAEDLKQIYKKILKKGN